MPDEVVFGRILPACGLMLSTSTLYYAWLVYKLAKETGRDDVTALPSGTSVPHMFVVVFVIMLPIALETGDPVKGWEAGLTWVFRASCSWSVASSHPSSVGSRPAPPARHARGRVHRLHLPAAGAGDVHDPGHRGGVFRHHPRELVRRRALFQGDPGRSHRHRDGHVDRLGLHRPRSRLWRDEPRKARCVTLELRFLLPGPGDRPRVLGLRVPGGHPGHRHPLRDLRPRRGHGQRRERLGGRGPIPDHARPDGRRGHQPHGLSHGQPLHPRGLHRASRMEGDWRAHRLFRGHRCDGDPLVLVRGRRAHDVARPGGGDLAHPALHRYADRRPGPFKRPRGATPPRSCWRWSRTSRPGASSRSTTR